MGRGGGWRASCLPKTRKFVIFGIPLCDNFTRIWQFCELLLHYHLCMDVIRPGGSEMTTGGKIVLPGALTGNFLVRAIRPAFHDAHSLFKSSRERAILRRHSLKLRFWPEKNHMDDDGTLMDLDWSWVNACKPKRIGELRIHDKIGDCDNLRVIFFDPEIREPLPTLWVLSVMQKKRNKFTDKNVATFKLRRQIVLERFYNV